ncbi:putative saccharopine dehydrogenase, NADP binding domain, NAD(P)-binding domain superfamily [Acrodontium crateriforme]|uniref:Saccharopine dehydrogenase, NADP binding domain, NAD(P)-binding domain superfamily n=1 Tax=Acrodontium crateriforme TaxID=150365 RepID=A0AAQ3MA39_9PEZI|nr:putative saccharopine dehydrogenase, NADP binding domain, NAD(P)-binding domain superfamily [Acrodontium crateriforme]
MAEADRLFECIVLGATGYTGKYTAEHIARQLPTDFKWAVAGRNSSKLEQLVNELQASHPDRSPPSIEVANLQKSELVALAKKTKVLISTVGPYHLYGSVVFEACAETGTHYLDVTGETPWVYDMINKYHETAKRSGAIMIPQNGVESAPPDLLCWSLVSYLRSTLNVGTGELVQSIYDMSAAPSGGTLATVLTIFDTYSISQFMKAKERWSMSTVAPPVEAKNHPGKSIGEQLTGVRYVKDLGCMTDSLQGAADTTLIHRSWSLYDGGKFYGPNFRVESYMRARNAFLGFFFHVSLAIGLLALALPPFRWLMKHLVYAPGQGPEKEEASKGHTEWRAIANADVSDPNDPKRAYARMRWEGSLYDLTGVCLAEAALTLARDNTLAHQIGGGVMTPATLGEAYMARLQKAGLKTEIKMLP